MKSDDIMPEALVRRMMIRYFAQSDEPVSWDIEKSDDGYNYTVTSEIPATLKNIMVRMSAMTDD